MELNRIVSNLATKNGAVFTFDGKTNAKHPYSELLNDVFVARQKLEKWGVKAGARVGLYAPNSYEWLVHDLALVDMNAISVPFTDDFADTLNEDTLIRYNISLLLISKARAALFPKKPCHVAFIDGPTPDAAAIDWSGPVLDGDDDILSMVFSSGSAGGLKGLMISRRGVGATVPPIVEAIGAISKDRLMLFLPMSNFQQRLMCYAALWNDFDIIITDFTQLSAAMLTLDPTILIAPPVFYQMVHTQVARLPTWKRALMTGLGRTLTLLPFAKAQRKIARILFAGFHAPFGKRMRLLITGMAPVRPGIAAFFNRMQLPLSESYGLVEAGSLTFRPQGSFKFGSVGRPVRDVSLLIAEDGEIIVQRDHPLTLRYFQCAEGENEKTFLGNGKVATGDIGRFDADGDLYLLGRKKELLVTPGGYKIHPEAVENELNGCAEVSQSVAFLRPNATHLTCVVAVTEPANDDAKARVQQYVDRMQTSRKLSPFVEVIFAEAPFTRENGMLRPNLKVDRKSVAAQYRI